MIMSRQELLAMVLSLAVLKHIITCHTSGHTPLNVGATANGRYQVLFLSPAYLDTGYKASR